MIKLTTSRGFRVSLCVLISGLIGATSVPLFTIMSPDQSYIGHTLAGVCGYLGAATADFALMVLREHYQGRSVR